MSRWWWWAASGLLCGACVTPAHVRAQQRAAQSMKPAAVEPDRAPPVEIAIYRVRAYADADFRARTPRWKDQLRARLERVNVVLAAVGARLVAEELYAWDRRGDATDLEAMLTELEAQDAGERVDWVIGLVTPGAAVTSNIHHLGLARILGKHFVLRSMDDVAEAAALEKIFPDLSARERAALYSERKLHKETVIFLHEWGHTLGAVHVSSAWDIMSPEYDTSQSHFAPEEIELLRRSLAARTGGDAEREAFRAYVEQTTWTEWDPIERQILVELLRESAPAARRREALRPVLARADDPTFHEATRLYAAGDPAAAWNTLGPLVEAYPNQAAVQVLACQIAAELESPQPAARATCARAAELRPDDPMVHVLRAWVSAGAGERSDAQAAAAKAHALLEGDAGAEAREWHGLAAAYRRLGAIARAEQAIAKTGDASAIAETAEWARRARRWCGLPAGVLDAEREGEFIEWFQIEYERLDANSARAVERRVEAEAPQFSPAPGLIVLRCAAQALRHDRKRAIATCTDAIAADGEAVLAHYHRAAALIDSKRHRDAARDLERAIELDPTLSAAWRVLAELYRDDSAKLRSLDERHRKQFGSSIDPRR